MNIIESHRFICQKGASNKQYTLTLEEQDGQYVIGGNYGPIGGRISPAPTTPCKDLPDAQKKLAAAIKKRLAKDYVYDGDASPNELVVAATKEDTGLRPQLLNEVDREEFLALAHNDAWGFQPKMNGDRRMARKAGDNIIPANRKGQRTTVPRGVENRLKSIPGDYTFDGELVGTTLYVFDLLDDNGEDLRAMPFIDRYERLVNRFIGDDSVRIVPLFVGTQNKLEAFATYEAQEIEGLVGKKLAAPVTEGRPNSGGDQVKFKFWESTSCIVASYNDGLRSIALEMFDKRGNRVSVGSVQVKQNQEFPPIEAVVEVKYLYIVSEGGSLVQAELIAVRDDIDPEECLTSTLKITKEAA